MSKIAPDHLSRQAFVYVRQSTQDQVLRNHESRRRQYGLADRAHQLGWSEPVVIDDDLGRSGGGVARPGFERLLVAICEGRAGIVLAVEASRLARNGRDWHTLLEFCGLVGCLLADEDGIYDPRLPNDRLLLGMKGTMSEMELSILRQRSLEALRQKARRGEIFLNIAVGYVKVRHDRIAKDPDLRVREALGLVFRKFTEFQSIRQVHLWMRQEQVLLPAVETGEDGRRIVWKPPVYSTVRGLLTNPVYGGYISEAIGDQTRMVRVKSWRQRGWDAASIQERQEGIRLIRPEQIRMLGPDAAIALVRDQNPVRLLKARYYEDRALNALFEGQEASPPLKGPANLPEAPLPGERKDEPVPDKREPEVERVEPVPVLAVTAEPGAETLAELSARKSAAWHYQWKARRFRERSSYARIWVTAV